MDFHALVDIDFVANLMKTVQTLDLSQRFEMDLDK